jgi:hypothetical protein
MPHTTHEPTVFATPGPYEGVYEQSLFQSPLHVLLLQHSDWNLVVFMAFFIPCLRKYRIPPHSESRTLVSQSLYVRECPEFPYSGKVLVKVLVVSTPVFAECTRKNTTRFQVTICP